MMSLRRKPPQGEVLWVTTPPTFSLVAESLFENFSPSLQRKAFPAAPDLCVFHRMVAEGREAPSSTSGAFSRAKFILIFCRRKGSRQLQRRPGTWKGTRPAEGNPQDLKTEGCTKGPASASLPTVTGNAEALHPAVGCLEAGSGQGSCFSTDLCI